MEQIIIVLENFHLGLFRTFNAPEFYKHETDPFETTAGSGSELG